MKVIPKGKSKIFVAGHKGLVGSAIIRELKKLGYSNILVRSHAELDLTNQSEVKLFFEKEKPNEIYLAAAKVGGIHANNSFPAEFIYQNIMIASNVIHEAFEVGITKLLFLGSSCIYPKNTAQPMTEEALLSGKLEPTNEPYAVAKIAGIKLCESYNRQFSKDYNIDYRSIMPTNLYGPGDNYHPENSHVIPGLIKRIHEAKIQEKPTVTIWGTGKPKREFLYVDDMAKACVFVMNLEKTVYQEKTKKRLSHINVGSGCEYTIMEIAREIASVVGYKGEILTDESKPDGMERKFLSTRLIKSLGWKARVGICDGLVWTYKDYLKNKTKHSTKINYD